MLRTCRSGTRSCFQDIIRVLLSCGELRLFNYPTHSVLLVTDGMPCQSLRAKYKCRECSFRPPIRHLFAENAAPHSNDSNGEVDLPQMMAVECPHWAANANRDPG